MSNRVVAVGVALTLFVAAACVIAQEALPGVEAAPDPLASAPPTDARHYSYAIGRDIGSSFRDDGMELDVDSLAAGLKDALAGAEPKYDEQLCTVAIRRMYVARNDKLRERGTEFLIKNAKEKGVERLPSGLQYKVLKTGDGASPKATDTVQVHYVGKFIDGETFDQSGEEPAEFQVDGVIPGWTEALQKMKVGDAWQLVIPAELAYGEQGDEVIPPHSTLIFEIELQGIK